MLISNTNTNDFATDSVVSLPDPTPYKRTKAKKDVFPVKYNTNTNTNDLMVVVLILWTRVLKFKFKWTRVLKFKFTFLNRSVISRSTNKNKNKPLETDSDLVSDKNSLEGVGRRNNFWRYLETLRHLKTGMMIMQWNYWKRTSSANHSAVLFSRTSHSFQQTWTRSAVVARSLKSLSF